MTKEERQKRSEELKAQRKEKALERKKAKEEKEKEKAWLKREEHKAILKRAKALLARTDPASTAVREEDALQLLSYTQNHLHLDNKQILWRHLWWRPVLYWSV